MSEITQFEIPRGEPNVYEYFPAVGSLLKELDASLLGLARNLISQYRLTVADPDDFLANPDRVDQHQPRYHQWGVISHTQHVLQVYASERVEHLLATWGVDQEVQGTMNEEIDGKSKKDLFAVAILTHDVGKFAQRQANVTDGRKVYSFKDHEKASGEIVRRDPMLQEMFSRFGLTQKQGEYVASCSELHYELGKLRRSNGSGLSREAANALMNTYPTYALEMGLFHLIDSLGKTDVEGSTDEEIATQLHARNLPPELREGVKQVGPNIQVARNYLLFWQEWQEVWESAGVRRGIASQIGETLEAA